MDVTAPDLTNMTRKTLKLVKDELVVDQHFSEAFLRRMKFREFVRPRLREMVWRLRSYVYYGERRDSLAVPSSWWQHLKETLKAHPRCPAWLRERLRVRYDYHNARCYLPDFDALEGRYGAEIFTWDGLRGPGGR